jgi:hypothetical protein
MKHIPYLLLFISSLAYSQDSLYLYGYPEKLTPKGPTAVRILPIKYKKVMVHQLKMGMAEAYIPESDIDNTRETLTKVIVYQIPLSQDVSEAKKLKIAKAIDDVLAAVDGPVYDTVRTVVTEIIDDSDPRNVLTGAMMKATNNVTANGFYQMTLTFRSNVTLPGKVTFKFTGDGFVWMGERRSTHGSVNVIVDGISYLVLCNEPLPKIQANDVELFRKVGMKNEEHTVELVPVGSSQFVHDRFVTYKTNITVVQR